MRCSYRCNMWCNCKKPAKPYPTTPSISGPSVDNVDVSTSSTTVNFTYTPTDATLDISFSSTNSNIAYADNLEYSGGQGHFTIYGGSGYGNATVTYINNDNPSETYNISATKVQPEPFNPTNSIYITKDTPGEAVQTKSRKSKKTLATAVGETYQAKMFAVDSSSANYVLMEWVYGGDAQITAWVGSAYNEYTTNLFNDQDVLNKIAREIEDYDNKHVLGDNIAKFSNGTWSRMESYFNNVYSPEVAQAIQGYIVEYGGTRFVTPYFNPEISDTSGNVGETVTIRGWKPDGGGLVIRDQSKMAFVEGGNVGEENYNYYMTYQLLREGTSAVGFQMYDGFTGTIDITAYPGSTPVEHISPITDHVAIFEEDPYGSFYFNYSPTTASYPRNEIEVTYSGDISDAYMEDYVVGRGRIIVYPTDVQQGSGTVTITHTNSGETFNVSVTIGGAHVESVSNPSESSVTLNVGQTSNNISIGQVPTEVADASRDVTLYTDNGNVAQIRWVDTTHGYICIDGISAGNTQVHYWLNSNPGTMYTIDVTVEEPTPAYVVNEHTMVYAPLKDTLNGEDGNGNIIAPDTLRLGATLENETARFAANGALRYNLSTTIPVTPMTVSLWVKPSFINDWLIAWYHENWTNVGVSNNKQWFTTDVQGQGDYFWGLANSEWNLLTIVYDNQNSTQKVYINGEYVGTNGYNYNVSQIDKIYLGARGYNDDGIQAPWNGCVSDFIVEDIAWDSQMISEYYEATKDRYPISTYTISIISNDLNKGTVDVETVTAQYGTTITTDDNTITIGETTVTATAETLNYFFTWTGVPATVTDDITITANFVDDISNPSLSFDLGDVGGLIQTPISVPGYKVSSINVSGTTGANPQRRGGIWLAVSNDDGTFSASSSSKWFGSYFFVGTKQGTDGAYSGEEKSSANAVNTLYRASDLGYGGIPTSLSVTYDASSAEYIYGQDDTTYTFSSYSYDIEPLLERNDLNFAVRGDGCTFDNVQVVVTYERSHITDLDNLSSNDVTVFEGQTTSVTLDYIPTDAVDLDQSLSIYSTDDSVCTVDWNKITDGTIQVDITGVSDGSYNQRYADVNIDLDGVTYFSVPVTVNPYIVTSVSNLSANSITLEPQQQDSITFEYSPADADTANVDISNSDDTVVDASLYDNGDGTMNIDLVALSVGTATLEILLDGGSGLIGTGLTVAVTVDFDNIKSVSNLSANSIALFEGDIDSSITFDYLPVDAADTSNVSIISDDPNIADAALSDLGNGVMEVDINALSAGTATLDIQLDGVSTGLTVTVTVDIDNIKSISNLSASSIRIPENNQDTVTFDYSPTDAADTSNVTVVSDDDSIATASLTDLGGQMEVVISTGNAGTATLDIQLNGVSTGETITVTVYTLTRITTVDTQPLTIGEGATGLIEFHYTPSDATDFSNITAVSDDDNIATTSFYGYSSGEAHFQISGVAEGSTSVTITDGVNDYPVQVIVTTPGR